MQNEPNVIYVERVVYDNSYWVLVAFAMMLIYFLCSFLLSRKWKKDVIIPQFSPPKNMSPAEMAYLIFGDFRTGMLSTLIIDLGVKKYIKIRKSNVNITYQLELLKQPDNKLSADEAQLMRDLFAEDSKIIINGDKNENINSACDNLSNSLRSQYRKTIRRGFRGRIFLLFSASIISFLYFGLTIYSYVKGSYWEVIDLLHNIGFYIFWVIVFLLLRPNRRSSKKLKTILLIVVGCLIAIQFWKLYILNPEIVNFLRVRCFLLVNFLVLFFIQDVFNKVSKEYQSLLNEIEGFKMYLSTAEEKQLQFLNAPKKTPEIFEKYLPYAMVFGVQKIWGKGFEQLTENSNFNIEDTDVYNIMDFALSTDENLVATAFHYAIVKNVVDIFK